MDEVQQGILDRVHSEVRERMSTQGAGHGWDHVERVWRNAKEIAAEVGGEGFIIELAALLHDLGDAKFYDGVERSGEFAREMLVRLRASQAVIDHVAHIVDNISFRKRQTAEPLSTEGQVVQDADRLDALGAIGIVRTIEYGASFDQPFYDPSRPEAKTGIGHFHEKLFHLKKLMNTVAGCRLAEEREQFMRQFLAQFKKECGE